MAVFPEPPFFYQLFDDTEASVYKELNEPPPIPEKRIIFGEEETDEIPANTVDEQNGDLIPRLQQLNAELFPKLIDILSIIQQPEYHLVELKKQQETQLQSSSPMMDGNESQLQPLIEHANVLTDKPMEQIQLQSGFEPSQLTPLINDRCESLKIVFREMREILNSLRAQQARQAVIHTLQKQLEYKQKKLASIHANIDKAQTLLQQPLNAESIAKDAYSVNDSEINLLAENKHTQRSIQRLKQTLDDAFFE